jgi:hypothetical protein
MKEGTEIYSKGRVKYHDGLDREAKEVSVTAAAL